MPHHESAIVDGVTVDLRHWIGGTRISSPTTFPDYSPLDESLLGDVAAGGANEVDEAVSAARAAFPAWAALPVAERSAILRRVADGIDARVEDLSRLETRDNGSLIRSHRRGVMPRVAMNFRAFADFAEQQLGHPDLEVRDHRERITYEPAGVVAIITPWNAPLMLATWRIGPALAAGNTVVLKPPEWAPLTASLLAEISAEAGLPPGVFNVVQGLGAEAGAALTAHPDINRLAFTGSVPTAGTISKAAAENIVPLSYELGGKSPLVVLEDADLDLAVSIAVEQFDNAGQVCLKAARMLVHSSLVQEFTERVVEGAATLRQGDPRDEATDVSALISRRHFEQIDGFVERALADGARALLGGGPNEELGGLYYRPTVLVDAPPGSEVLTEEVFGPVVTIESFETEAQAVQMANDSRFGLAATLVTGDRTRAERVSAQLDAGTVWVNCFFVRDLEAPFGGNGRSGIGREGGIWSFDFYTNIKNSVFSPQGWKEN
ncbi:aldehyde dehydrogenase [Aeromicrobium fastidiosum]|uniref:Aldehyde dehydrogenase n=1 Tax=Aeromicrobium fastidiosum TaxID=52699 RepID=A0A641AUQ7_9ACTN|nr:aldehyde dehydrogenase [Aeromicrobium fastidiosum]KAA1380588.1 aldehyde dehydrogenase [Aeromicrobium fastidiosum]MBP2390186.1 5-carboxymethyl-2-hydroxymuconic-semialdehyde dehydrogenase [Aeromicrobium fastidiosum]